MTKGIMILSERIPWLMELKDRIEKIAYYSDESVQFRLSRNLITASLSSEEGRQEYLYVVLGDLFSKAELGMQLQYIFKQYPYAKIVGVRKVSELSDVPEAGKYVYRKKGIKIRDIRIVEEDGLESYFKKELEQLETFAQQVYRLREIEEEQRKADKNHE